MKKNSVYLIVIALSFIVFTAAIESDNGKAGYVASSGETTCTNCHSSFALNSGGGILDLSSTMNNWQYVPGQTYTVNLKVKRTGNHLFGMGLEALTTANANAGTLTITNTHTQIKTRTVNNLSRRNVVHTLNGGNSQDSMIFTFDWVAPATNIGNVTMYYSCVAANANGSENGDYVYNTSQVITPYIIPTGLTSSLLQSSFSLYPLPAHDNITINYYLTSQQTVSFNLYNLNGKLVDELLTSSIRNGSCSDHFKLNPSLGKGIYLLKLSAGNESVTRKLVID